MIPKLLPSTASGDSSVENFSSNGYIESNLQALYQVRIEQQSKDITVLVCGAPGNGKSALTWFCGEWMAGNIEPVTFNWDNVAFTHNQWIDNEKDVLQKYEVSWYDEGYNTFYRRNAMTSENREGKTHLNQYRFKHHPRFINFQDIINIEPDLLFSEEIGVELLLRCVKQGWVHGYSQRTIQNIKIRKKKSGETLVNWPTPDFRDTWPDPQQAMPEKWQQYEEVNEEKVKEDPDDQEQDNGLTVKEMAKVVIAQGDNPDRSDFVNEYNGRKYVDKDLVAGEFGIGDRLAKKVKKRADKKLGIG